MPESQPPPTRGSPPPAAIVVAASLAVALVAPASAASSTSIGPSTVTAPYILPVADGVHIESLLTVGDGGAAATATRWSGSRTGSASSTGRQPRALHEPGAPRRRRASPGATVETGAFVSRWVIDPEDGSTSRKGSTSSTPGSSTGTTRAAPTSRPAPAGPMARSRTRPSVGSAPARLSNPGVFYNESTGPATKARSTSATKRTATSAARSV